MTIATVAGLHDAISVASEDAYETREGDSLNKDRWYERQTRADLRRTPEAQADIAAARAPDGPSCGHAMFHPGCASCLRDHLSDASTEIPPASAASLDTALSNAALADTPAVREMGWPARRGGQPCPDCGGVLTGMAHVCPDTAAAIDRFGFKAPMVDPANLPPGAVLLTGNEAAHYRRLQDAARASQAAQNALATAGAELRDAFGALCRAISVEPSKEP